MGHQQMRGKRGRDNGLKFLFLWWITETPVPPISQASFTSFCVCSFPTFLVWLTSQSRSMVTIPYDNGCLCSVSVYSDLTTACLPFPPFLSPSFCPDRSRTLRKLKARTLYWIHLVAYWLGPYLWLHVGSNLGPLVRIPIEWLHAHEQISRVWHVKRTGRTWKGKSEAPESQKGKGSTLQPTAKRRTTCKATPQIKCKTKTASTEPG